MRQTKTKMSHQADEKSADLRPVAMRKKSISVDVWEQLQWKKVRAALSPFWAWRVLSR